MKNKAIYSFALYKNIQFILIIIATIAIAYCINVYVTNTRTVQDNKNRSCFGYEKATFILSTFILLLLLLP